MRQPREPAVPGRPDRRHFLGQSLATTAAAAVGLPAAVAAPSAPTAGWFTAGDDRLRVGLIGCGGRGTGAALQAAAADPAVRITALGDLFADQLAASCRVLAAGAASQFECPPDRRFVGADAYRRVIAAGVDVVLLAAPPHVRPLHVEAAVRAGRHVYCEKPVAVDAAGVRRVVAACRLARAARLSIVSGLCHRHDTATVEAMARIRDGAVGRPLGVRTRAEIGLPWRVPAPAASTEAEWRLRNWISHRRLSGGAFVEHHILAIDRAVWALGDDEPLWAVARLLPVRGDAWSIGDCLAGVAATFTFADGRWLEASCRRAERHGHDGHGMQVMHGMQGVEETVVGTSASCGLPAPGPLTDLPPAANPFQSAMNRLVASVRSATPVDDAGAMCRSTMIAVLGREAAESGRLVTWDDVAGTDRRLA